MAKYKKKKRKTASAELTPTGAVKAQIKKFNWRRLLFIVLTTALAFGVYEALIMLNFLPIGGIPIIMPVYFVIVTALVCAILILNSGVSTKPVTVDMLRDGEDDDIEHLQEICDKLNRRKAIAKRLMLVLLPFLLAIFFDILYLFYGDFFAGAISLLVPNGE